MYGLNNYLLKPAPDVDMVIWHVIKVVYDMSVVYLSFGI